MDSQVPDVLVPNRRNETCGWCADPFLIHDMMFPFSVTIRRRDKREASMRLSDGVKRRRKRGHGLLSLALGQREELQEEEQVAEPWENGRNYRDEEKKEVEIDSSIATTVGSCSNRTTNFHHYPSIDVQMLYKSEPRRRRRKLLSRASFERVSILVVRLALMILGCYIVVCYTSSNHRSSLRQSGIVLPTIEDLQTPELEWPALIHIVNTRFMQEQAHLTTLGQARYHLFETFCFPTMVAQSSQNFLWIVKTDPKLEPNLLQQLIDLLKPYPNFYLVASNTNFLIPPIMEKDGASWRDGSEGRDILASKIFTGKLDLLQQAIALREVRPVLETRLDADDGLHKYFVEYLQNVAWKRFSNHHNLQWLYWCSRRHLEWHNTIFDENNDMKASVTTQYQAMSSRGILAPVQHSTFCITPGMTVGYNVGVAPGKVPCHPHDILYDQVINTTSCWKDNKIHSDAFLAEDLSNLTDRAPSRMASTSCLEFVDDLLYVAVRSRTVTSAGMRNVGIVQSQQPERKWEEKLWWFAQDRFAMDVTHVEHVQQYIRQHQSQIAYENLLGQCTTGHSCKDQAKEALIAYSERGGLANK